MQSTKVHVQNILSLNWALPSPEGIWVESRGHAMRALRSSENHAANRRTRCKFKCSSRAFQRGILGLRAPTDGSIRCAASACFGSRRGGEKALPSPEGKESARDKRATARLEGPAPRSVAPWHHWDPNTRRYVAHPAAHCVEGSAVLRQIRFDSKSYLRNIVFCFRIPISRS